MAAAMIRHATANLFKDLGFRDVSADLAELTGQSDVIGCQEVNSVAHKNAVMDLKQRGWGVYWPGGQPKGKPDGPNQIPILWRSSLFVVVSTGHEKMFDGGMGSPSRWIAWVILRHKKTGALVVRMNTHFIHQAFTSHPDRRHAWDVHLDKMIAKIRDLTKRFGPVITGGDVNRDHFQFPAQRMIYTGEGTFGAAHYDPLMISGAGLTHGTPKIVHTNSDHDAVVVAIATLAPPAKPEAPKPAPKPADAAKPPLPVKAKPQKPIGPATYVRMPPTKGRYRYLAQSLDGNGAAGNFFEFDLPLSDVSITDTLSGYNSLSGTIAPKNRRLLAPDGDPLIGEWQTAIYAEQDGQIRGGGIVKTSTFDNEVWNIETVGFAGYADGMPWISSDGQNYLGVGVDPLDVVRVIWDHIQSKPGGNIGLEIPNVKTGIKIGLSLEQIQYDTQSGPLAFESGPVQINWYTDHNLGEKLIDFATKTPFDWHERHFWDGESMRHVLDIGYPELGRRRDDLRFVVGENVSPVPSIDSNGDDYATEVLVLGAGEGRQMVRGGTSRQRNGLRRVAVVADSSLANIRAANSRAESEIAWRSKLETISTFSVRNTPHAPLGGYAVGDEVYFESNAGWRSMGVWVRITSITIQPGASDLTVVNVVPTDRISQ